MNSLIKWKSEIKKWYKLIGKNYISNPVLEIPWAPYRYNRNLDKIEDFPWNFILGGAPKDLTVCEKRCPEPLHRIFKITKKSKQQMHLEEMYRHYPSIPRAQVDAALILSNNNVEDAKIILELRIKLECRQKRRNCDNKEPITEPLNLTVESPLIIHQTSFNLPATKFRIISNTIISTSSPKQPKKSLSFKENNIPNIHNDGNIQPNKKMGYKATEEQSIFECSKENTSPKMCATKVHDDQELFRISSIEPFVEELKQNDQSCLTNAKYSVNISKNLPCMTQNKKNLRSFRKKSSSLPNHVPTSIRSKFKTDYFPKSQIKQFKTKRCSTRSNISLIRNHQQTSPLSTDNQNVRNDMEKNISNDLRNPSNNNVNDTSNEKHESVINKIYEFCSTSQTKKARRNDLTVLHRADNSYLINRTADFKKNTSTDIVQDSTSININNLTILQNTSHNYSSVPSPTLHNDVSITQPCIYTSFGCLLHGHFGCNTKSIPLQNENVLNKNLNIHMEISPEELGYLSFKEKPPEKAIKHQNHLCIPQRYRKSRFYNTEETNKASPHHSNKIRIELQTNNSQENINSEFRLEPMKPAQKYDDDMLSSQSAVQINPRKNDYQSRVTTRFPIQRVSTRKLLQETNIHENNLDNRHLITVIPTKNTLPNLVGPCKRSKISNFSKLQRLEAIFPKENTLANLNSHIEHNTHETYNKHNQLPVDPFQRTVTVFNSSNGLPPKTANQKVLESFNYQNRQNILIPANLEGARIYYRHQPNIANISCDPNIDPFQESRVSKSMRPGHTTGNNIQMIQCPDSDPCNSRSFQRYVTDFPSTETFQQSGSLYNIKEYISKRPIISDTARHTEALENVMPEQRSNDINMDALYFMPMHQHSQKSDDPLTLLTLENGEIYETFSPACGNNTEKSHFSYSRYDFIENHPIKEEHGVNYHDPHSLSITNGNVEDQSNTNRITLNLKTSTVSGEDTNSQYCFNEAGNILSREMLPNILKYREPDESRNGDLLVPRLVPHSSFENSSDRNSPGLLQENVPISQTNYSRQHAYGKTMNTSINNSELSHAVGNNDPRNVKFFSQKSVREKMISLQHDLEKALVTFIKDGEIQRWSRMIQMKYSNAVKEISICHNDGEIDLQSVQDIRLVQSRVQEADPVRQDDFENIALDSIQDLSVDSIQNNTRTITNESLKRSTNNIHSFDDSDTSRTDTASSSSTDDLLMKSSNVNDLSEPNIESPSLGFNRSHEPIKRKRVIHLNESREESDEPASKKIKILITKENDEYVVKNV